MKTAITIINTHQVGMEEYRDVKTTKIFDDNTTIGQIKEWVVKAEKMKVKPEDIGISGIDISDVEE